MNDKLMNYLGRHKDKYPVQLEASYPRIVEKIAKLWSSPRVADYFSELLIDDRGGRQGFPPAIAREIYRLSVTYDEILAKAAKEDDVWSEERELAKRELMQISLKFVPAHMLKAAQFHDPARVVLFLKAGMSVDARDERNWTALMVAAFNGHLDVVKVLMEHGADPHARDLGGYTALHWASLNGHLEVAQLLLDRGVDPNARSNSNWTSLLQAATNGHSRVVALLLDADADPHIASNEGWTPLHKAVANGHARSVRMLMRAGASVHARHRDGSTPLSLAEKSSCPDVQKMMRSLLDERLELTLQPRIGGSSRPTATAMRR